MLALLNVPVLLLFSVCLSSFSVQFHVALVCLTNYTFDTVPIEHSFYVHAVFNIHCHSIIILMCTSNLEYGQGQYKLINFQLKQSSLNEMHFAFLPL